MLWNVKHLRKTVFSRGMSAKYAALIFIHTTRVVFTIGHAEEIRNGRKRVSSCQVLSRCDGDKCYEKMRFFDTNYRSINVSRRDDYLSYIKQIQTMYSYEVELEQRI